MKTAEKKMIVERTGVKVLGHCLVIEIVKKLIDQGYNSMLVWVLAMNRYRRFYEKLGGKFLRSQQIEIGSSSYEAIEYGWKDLGHLVK